MAIVLTVGGVDISDQVYVTRSNFVSNAGPMPGNCQIAVKDASLVQAFTIGDRILLTVDGLNKWAGYLTKIQRTYPFDAFSPPSIRNFVLLGVEIGILFQRRWVYNQSDPTQDAPDYPGNTQDTEILADLFDDWLRLGGDNLDVTTKVHNLGVFAEDQKGSPIAAGQPWGTTMSLLASRLAPIWGINADRQLIWADVDQESAPFGISDHPGAGEIGCKGLAILFDATEMINDALVIGAGGGSPTPVYSREIADASVEEHGTWQMGMVAYNVYKQATVNQIADSWVHGSSTSRRGHKNDRVSATCTIWENGFRPGMVVHLESGVWGWSDNIPIRSMRISWPATTVTRYDLTLSHELDTPMNLTDPVRLADLGGGGGGGWHPPEIPIIDVVPPEPEECDDEFCGITDSYERFAPNPGISGPVLGTADAGFTYTGAISAGGMVDVDGSRAHFRAGDAVSSTYGSVNAQANLQLSNSSGYLELQIPSVSTISDASIRFIVGGGTGIHLYTGAGLQKVRVTRGSTVTEVTYAFSSVSYGVRWVHSSASGGTTTVRVWPLSAAEPGGWTVTATGAVLTTIDKFNIIVHASAVRSEYWIEHIDIDGVSRCAATQFDNFNRLHTSGWGGATPSGYQWLLLATEVFGINSPWKFMIGAHGHSPGFELPGFNDTSWPIGNGAFGMNSGTSYVLTTQWPSNTSLCVRRMVTVPADVTEMRLIFGVDNNATVFWKGVNYGTYNHEGAALPTNYNIGVPATAGETGLLAVRCVDEGIASYFGMSGSTGGAALPALTTVGVDANGGWLSLPAGAGLSQQLHIRGDGPWVSPRAFTFRARFTINTMPSTAATVRFATANGGTNSAYFTFSPSTLSIAVGTSGATLGPGLLLVANVQYVLEWEHDPVGSVSRARLYLYGGTVPDWQITRSTPLELNEIPDWNVSLYTTSAAVKVTFRDMEFEYEGKPCAPGAPEQPVGGGGAAIAGRTCQDFEGGGDTFQTTQDLWSGTVEVFINGLFVNPADVVASTTGLVTLAYDTAPSDTVRICYEIRDFNR